MRRLFTRIMVSLALMAFGIMPASADETCTRMVTPQALDALQIMMSVERKIVPGQVERVESALKQCPDHAWINAIGSELDLTIYRMLKDGNGGVPNQDAVNYLLRAFERSNKFHEGPSEGRQSLYNIVTSVNAYSSLEYLSFANSRKAIMDGLVQIALMGSVHPYLAGTAPIKCGGWAVSDGQTVSYQIDTAEELILMPFVDALAEACRPGRENSDIVPLALKARAYAMAVEYGAVTDAEDIRQYLTIAQQAADDYIAVAGTGSTFYDQFAVKRLDNLKRKHSVFTGPGPETIERTLWFTPDHIGSDAAIRSIVYSLDAYWSPLAAGETDASMEEVSTARSQLASYLLALRKEGADAGFKDRAGEMVLQAFKAYHSREILSPERDGRQDMPPWFYDMMVKVLDPMPAPENP